MSTRIFSELMLILLLITMLSSVLKVEPATAKPRTPLVDNENLKTPKVKNILNQIEPEPTYVGVAKYYDNRKCVVTSTHDDLVYNASAWQNCLLMLTEKKIYHTVGIITNYSVLDNDWDFVQYWVDQGYTEAGSHSRNHVHVPYTGTENSKNKVSYEWQINGSKNDIIGNLTLPNWWRFGDREYVYAWIEPYGSCDNTVRQWLGYCHYLCDRMVGGGTYGFAEWDSSNGLFNRVSYMVEMGSPPWGGDTSVSSLNAKFDVAYNNGKIYHLITHPIHVNWSKGSYADQHTDYISNRKDVWYVPFGLLYLYHWVDTQNIVNVTSTGSGLKRAFKLSISATDHLNYGVSYPITYVFDVPSDWTSGYVYYRYIDTDSWTLIDNKSSEEFFNGIDASRFDFTNHKAYISIGFSNVSHNIYLQLCRSKNIRVPDDYPTIQEAINAANLADTIYVYNGIYHENILVNKTVTLIGEEPSLTIIDGNYIETVVNITANSVSIIGFTIQDSGYSHCGILLYQSSNNTISENNIINNEYHGVKIYNSSFNKFYHNNFINNTIHISTSPLSVNVWDDGYPSGGNYWSDYTGVDANQDGIGDTPYAIDVDNQDDYPLMNPWTPPNIDVLNVTTSKTVVGQGFTLHINVTVQNKGNKIEAFNVSVFYNDTVIILPDGKNYTTTTLTSGNSTTLTIPWNTTDVAKGNYTITAKATILPGETDNTDNTYTDGWVIVTMIGDFTSSGYPPPSPPDGVIDINDIRYFTNAYKSQYGIPPPPEVDPTKCDLTGDGYPPASPPDDVINFNDIRYFIDLYKAQYT